MKLFLENVRSFEGWHEIPIAPATVLLGENSAGKSTLLGMLSLVRDEGFPFGGNIFNLFPFEFGGYKNVASAKRGVTYFSIGFEGKSSRWHPFLDPIRKKINESIPIGLVVAFRENNGLSVPCHILAWMGDMVIIYCEEEFENLERAVLKDYLKNKNLIRINAKKSDTQGLSSQRSFRDFYETMESNLNNKREFQEFSSFFHMMESGFFRYTDISSTLAFAPMRSRPKRTYDQLSDEFSPEGDHVPLLLARAIDPKNKQAKALHEAIQSFGRYSGMFSDINVKQLGRGSGDPFQVQVKIDSRRNNLMDVGYGVSQVLPLIVDAQRDNRNTTLLLQQPEVHLHPKAQAALGSMIKDWITKGQKTVVVETHSDYLVDRLRLEIKRKNLLASDLIIYFLEQKNKQTIVHHLRVDEQGNILDAPDGYRDFFLHEQMALLLGD